MLLQVQTCNGSFIHVIRY